MKKRKKDEQAKVGELKENIADKEREKKNNMEERLNNTKTNDELKKQDAELELQNEEGRAVINDDNTPPSEKEAAQDRVTEREGKQRRIRTQIEVRERAQTLREKVKEIFLKR